MFYRQGQFSYRKSAESRFLVTLKTKWKDFTPKNQE